MKTMILKSVNGKLDMAELPKPTCKPDEVLIKVLSTSLNFADTLLMSGNYQEKPKLPFAPGMEVCGLIEKVGRNNINFDIGQRVVAYVGFGGLAEFVTAKQCLCFPIPGQISNEKAASLLIAYGSTEIALNYRAKLKKEETLLVLGASGGVGLSAVQIGKAMGAFVIAVARGDKKCLLAKSMGADMVFDSAKVELKKELEELKRIDVVYDPVGGSQFKDALSIAKPETRIIPVGFASGEVPNTPANIIMVKNVTLIGFQIGAYRSFKPSVIKECFSRLVEMWSQRVIDPQVTRIFCLEQANEALELIRERKSIGKIVVSIQN